MKPDYNNSEDELVDGGDIGKHLELPSTAIGTKVLVVVHQSVPVLEVGGLSKVLQSY